MIELTIKEGLIFFLGAISGQLIYLVFFNHIRFYLKLVERSRQKWLSLEYDTKSFGKYSVYDWEQCKKSIDEIAQFSEDHRVVRIVFDGLEGRIYCDYGKKQVEK